MLKRETEVRVAPRLKFVIVALACVCATVGYFVMILPGSGACPTRDEMTIRALESWRAPLEAWREENGSSCPSPYFLSEAGRSKRLARKDPWGNDFWLRCWPGGFELTSSGRDRSFGTDDDHVMAVTAPSTRFLRHN